MNNIEEIITRYITGEAAEDEMEFLLDWIKLSEENKKYFAELVQIANGVRANQISPELMEVPELILPDSKAESKPGRLKQLLVVWQKVAAVVLIPLLIAFLFLKSNDNGLNSEQAQVRELYTPEGVRAKIALDDGTIVWLNSDTKLKYSSHFGDEFRNVELIRGEAFFEVAHEKSRPFITTVKGLKVKVHGTSFNVNSYDDQIVETSLLEGSVELINDAFKDGIMLSPGEKATFNLESGDIPICNINKKKIAGWRDGKILFFDTPMKDVISMLEQWYNVQIEVRNEEIYDYRFTASIKDKSLPELLQLLKVSSPIGYRINGNQVTIFKNTLNQ